MSAILIVYIFGGTRALLTVRSVAFLLNSDKVATDGISPTRISYIF
jgi:hypothetical protein